ncbi:uncharacterized protein LOC134911131 [Pseudophryne corroboree]|uniref:uncharacterized protein LOC134911131 n=1 Tax=Pseudophryne corroboree TaxID=495146 RepID=UPI003081FB82
MLMAQPMKHRPRSAPIITNAYVQNKREDEGLSVKLDSIHYQHHADLIRLRQTVDPIVRLRKNLLTQRAITHQSSLEHVMDEIHAYKKDKHCSGLSKSHLPASTEVYVSNGESSKWLPTPFSQSFPSIPHNLYKHGESKTFSVITNGRRLPVMDNSKTKSTETALKHLEASEKPARKARAMSPVQRVPTRNMELLTYKELSKIACLENITMRELERQKLQVQMDKHQLCQTLHRALQERVHTFLKKIDEVDCSNSDQVINADKDFYETSGKTTKKN